MDKFAENNNGLPLYTEKLESSNRKIGEIGISYMTEVYNKWITDGLIIDEKKSASGLAIDFNTLLFKNKLNITGEYANFMVVVPSTFPQQYDNKQWAFIQMSCIRYYKEKCWDGIRQN